MSSLQKRFLEDEAEHFNPSRRLVRERVMQTLYAREITREAGMSEAIDFLAEHLVYPEFQSHPELLEFATTLLNCVYNHNAECDEIIQSLAEHWDLHRIAPIDRVLLRMGLIEMLYFPEIPSRVSINEVIDIAKRYSTDKSGVFINGVLDAARGKLKSEGKLTKVGRGLLGEDD